MAINKRVTSVHVVTLYMLLLATVSMLVLILVDLGVGLYSGEAFLVSFGNQASLLMHYIAIFVFSLFTYLIKGEIRNQKESLN